MSALQSRSCRLMEYAGGGMRDMLYFGNGGMWGFFGQWEAYVSRQSSSSLQFSKTVGAEGVASVLDVDDNVWMGWT
jgi:hypothetical protein